jgi:hypothetical protein
LADCTPDCFPFFSADQLQQLALRSATAVPAVPSLSPCVTAALTATSSSRSSHFGLLNFLDYQPAFVSIFPNLAPLLLTASAAGVSIDSLSLPSSITKFLDRCKFSLFVPIFRSGYVGAFARDDAASLQATVSSIKKIAMSSRHPTSGAWVNMQPEEVFAACSDLIPLLPSQVSVWGLNLVTQHFDSLSMELSGCTSL